jgi:Ser/Thr protein kinase RdoA (MazF antagonist)
VTEAQRILDRLGIAAERIHAIPSNHGPEGNANWHVWPVKGERFVLRRYHVGTTPDDLQYEHAILAHLSSEGWCVPEPLAPAVHDRGRWYCPTRYVAGKTRSRETATQRRQRGADLARLHVALRPLAARIGQRVGWRPLDEGLPVMTPVDWLAGLDALEGAHPQLAEWAAVVADAMADELARLDGELPRTVLHGDFMAEQNVHYDGSRLVGVIDFGVAHLGTRPYDLLAARCCRAPEVWAAYVEEMRALGWPLSESEQAAVMPIYRGFRLGMVAWQLKAGMRTGRFDTQAIETQLAQTGVTPSGTIQLAGIEQWLRKEA